MAGREEGEIRRAYGMGWKMMVRVDKDEQRSKVNISPMEPVRLVMPIAVMVPASSGSADHGSQADPQISLIRC